MLAQFEGSAEIHAFEWEALGQLWGPVLVHRKEADLGSLADVLVCRFGLTG